MSCEIIVRPARSDDLKQRMELVRRGFSGYFWSAFLFFLFQELTLECCVLAGAVLFIFCGASPGGCALLAPAAALLVAAMVAAAHAAAAHKHAQSVREEMFGFVAEVRGALLLVPGAGPVPVRIQTYEEKESGYSQVVGTVSVSEFWGVDNSGWLHALAVHPEWRGRGAGRALCGAARAAGGARGLRALEAAAGALQPAARAALAAAGWQSRGAYERPLLGAALTLPLLRLGLDLPLA